MTKKSILFAGIALILILSLNHDHAQSSTNTEFITSFDNPFCDIDTGKYWWTTVGTSGTMESSLENCYKPSVDDESSNTCCPTDYVCDRTSGAGEGGNCVPSTLIEDCSDYKTEPECTGFSGNIAANDVKLKISPLSCGSSWINNGCENYISDCTCFWNMADGKCESSYNLTSDCSGTTSTLGRCVFNTNEKSNCTAGLKIIGWTATPEGALPPEVKCVTAQKTVACLFSELDFFTDISMVVAVTLITVFYIFSMAGKNRKKIKR